MCKRRVLPGDPDSESEDSDNGQRNPTRSSAIDREPNDDDDTNESSRLLVTNRDQSANTDDQSICTTVTTATTNPNTNNDTSSLNNQMTNSMSSSQLPGKEMMRSSSKYGSISSINKLQTATSGAYCNQACVEIDMASNSGEQMPRRSSKPHIDSKASPGEYHTPESETSETCTGIMTDNVQPSTSASSSYVLNVVEKNFQLKKVDSKAKNPSKKSKSSSKKVNPLPSTASTATTANEIATQTSKSSQSDSDNLEAYASCKDEFNIVDQVMLIQPVPSTNNTAVISAQVDSGLGTQIENVNEVDPNALTKIV